MEIIERIRKQAGQQLKTILLPEGTEERMLKAADILVNEKIVRPVLLGDKDQIQEKAMDLNLELQNVNIIYPKEHENLNTFAESYYELRKHKGITREKAKEIMHDPLYFAAMMLRNNQADGAVAGSIHPTGDVLRAGIQIVGLMPNVNVVSSCFVMALPNAELMTFGDCAVIPDPDPEQLASITASFSNTHQKLVGTDPRVAMLSFSTKGSAKHEMAEKVVKATQIAQEKAPNLIIDGELQFDAAYIPAIGERKAPDSKVAGKANTFIFPDLNSGNIGYKMVQRLAGAEAIGPIIQGLAKPYNDLSRGCSVDDIVNVAAICSILS